MEIPLSQFVRALRRRWWALVVCVLVLGLLGLAYGRSTDVTYTATTSLLVTSQVTGDEILTDSGRTMTYRNLVTSGPVLDLVILDLDLDYNRADLSQMVTATGISNTQIINIAVTSDDPQEAADIANSITRNFMTVVSDLSVGEVQRSLDNLTSQSETLQGQMAVIDTRLADLDARSTDSQVQAEIAGLKRDRLQLSQTLVDVDSSIRDLKTQLNTMSVPVVVTDFATPPEGVRSVSPILMAVVGAFVGGLIGAAWIVWVAATDSVIRDRAQIVSGHFLGATRPGPDHDDQILLAKLLGAIEQSGAQRVAIVSASSLPKVGELSDLLSRNNVATVAANGILGDAAALQKLGEVDAAVVVAASGKTPIPDLDEVAEVLEVTGVRPLGTILVNGK